MGQSAIGAPVVSEWVGNVIDEHVDATLEDQ